MQKQQVSRTEGVEYRQIDLFPAAPEFIDQRLGIEFAIKREKQGNGMRHHNGRISHHAGRGLLREMGLLLRR